MTLSAHDKRRLLTVMLREKGISMADTSRADRIPRRDDVGPSPLSFNQEAMWFIERFDPGKASYNIPATVRLNGRLDVQALERTLTEIVRRHESLRTTFHSNADGSPFQTVGTPDAIAIPVIDLQGWPEPERDARAVRLAIDEPRRPFDLTRGPLLRALLVRLGPEQHVLILTFHQIVTDGWSMGVFTRELTTLYEGFRGGSRPALLPELPIQYADFARWQRRRVRGPALEAQRAYWKQQLGSRPPVLSLPTDRPRPALTSFEGRHHPIRLPRLLSDDLRDLSKREGVTLFMSLLAAFNVLLYRYTGQDDIMVGSTFANRSRSEIEGLIGFFVNVLPLRTRLSGNPAFREVLRRVRAVTLGAAAHQELPLSEVVKEIEPQRDPTRNPLFEVVFYLLTPDRNPAVYGFGLSEVAETIELQDLTMTPLEAECGVARFDIVVLMWDMPDGISGTVEYRTELFDPATITRLVDQFVTVLRLVAARPDVRLDTIVSRLDEEEQQQQRLKEQADKDVAYQKLRRIRPRSTREPVHTGPAR